VEICIDLIINTKESFQYGNQQHLIDAAILRNSRPFLSCCGQFRQHFIALLLTTGNLKHNWK